MAGAKFVRIRGSQNQQEVIMGDQDELLQIQKALERFVEKHGGQYICTVIWPERPAKKGTIPMGSSHVRIMKSQPYAKAVDALVKGEEMFSKKAERFKGKEAEQMKLDKVGEE